MAGNFRALTLNVEPTGEKHKMICTDEEGKEKERVKYYMVIKERNAVNCGGSEPLQSASQMKMQST